MVLASKGEIAIIQWIFYGAGIVFLSVFLISVLAKPIVFRQKLLAGVVYGLVVAICFFLFFMSQYSDYNSQQAYFKDQIGRLTTSNWKSPEVKGTVVAAVNSTTANSTGTDYVGISLIQNQSLKDDLIALQNDLSTLQNSINSGKTTKGQLFNNQITAFLDNDGPIQNSTINLIVANSPGTSITPGTSVTAVCHYDTIDSTCMGIMGNNGRAVIQIKIGKATPGYQVDVDVTAGNANTRTTFRVQ